MAVIRPYRGLRFSPDAGSLDSLVAPPYDVLNSDERNALAAQSEHNIVHLTLPEAKPDDRSKYVKYARSAAGLAEWRRQGALVAEESPALYRYVQEFSIPGSPATFTRTAFITLIKLEPFETGVVLPHEQTFPKHKEDRLRILEATRAHLENIFGLFEDEGNEVITALQSAPVTEEFTVVGADGVTHRLAPIVDPNTIQHIQDLIAAKTIWIADGHHRYETALAFREALGNRDGEVPEDFMPIALASMSDPGLVLLPTHRVVIRPMLTTKEVLARLEPYFTIRPAHSGTLLDELAAEGAGKVTDFGLAAGDELFMLVPKDVAGLRAMIPGDDSEALKSLDVTLLHRVIFEQLLDIRSLDGMGYTRDPEEALESARSGAQVWLMNPPTVDDMKTIALGGERMPQKSTYYFPKIQSGFVLWSLNDF